MSKISQNIFCQALGVLLFSDNINAFPNDLKLTQFPTGFLELVVQKLVILTWVFVKVERNFPAFCFVNLEIFLQKSCLDQ